MRILIVGGRGYLGGEVARQALRAGQEIWATCFSSPGEDPGVRWLKADVRERADADAVVSAARPGVVVNVAFRQDDWMSTADGAANVALAAVRYGVRLVHVSSDAVFSGTASSYDETAAPDPVTAYGAAKAAAETAIRAVDPAAAIVRTSLIIGDGDSVHEALVHDLIAGRRDGVLFADDIRCPVHVADLASALLELAATQASGIHHVAGTDAVSRHELGRLIARRDGLDATALRSGLRARQPTPGPVDVRLDCRKTQARLRTRLRGAREFLTG